MGQVHCEASSLISARRYPETLREHTQSTSHWPPPGDDIGYLAARRFLQQKSRTYDYFQAHVALTFVFDDGNLSAVDSLKFDMTLVFEICSSRNGLENAKKDVERKMISDISLVVTAVIKAPAKCAYICGTRKLGRRIPHYRSNIILKVRKHEPAIEYLEQSTLSSVFGEVRERKTLLGKSCETSSMPDLPNCYWDNESDIRFNSASDAWREHCDAIYEKWLLPEDKWIHMNVGTRFIRPQEDDVRVIERVAAEYRYRTTQSVCVALDRWRMVL